MFVCVRLCMSVLCVWLSVDVYMHVRKSACVSMFEAVKLRMDSYVLFKNKNKYSHSGRFMFNKTRVHFLSQLIVKQTTKRISYCLA